MSRAARAWLVVAALVGVAATLVWFLREDVQTFRIPSESMTPTLDVDDRVDVNKDAYGDEDPQVGEIVVIHPPEGALDGRCYVSVDDRLCPRAAGGPADVFFVQRIVAGPGDRLRVRDGRAIVDGRPLDEPYAADCEAIPACTFRGELTIPRDHYFMMGDNRGASSDSRFWGPVPRDQIVGRAEDCWPLGLRCSETDDPG